MVHAVQAVSRTFAAVDIPSMARIKRMEHNIK
jgi:hypothetical protein